MPSTSSMDFEDLHKSDQITQRRSKIDLIRSNNHRHISRVDRFSIDSEAGASSQVLF